MTELDPYAELDVPRDADEKRVRKAYRSKSKGAHPNSPGGGDPEKWSRLSTSLAVLTDPAKRKIFDDTGRIEEDKPDVDGAAALGIIQEEIGKVVSSFIADGMNPGADPRKSDVLAVVKRRIRNSIAEGEDAVPGGERVIAFLKDMAERFAKRKNPDMPDIPGDDPIARGFRDQVRGNEQQLADLRKSIRWHRLALQIVEGYDFRWDKPEPRPETYGDRYRARMPDGEIYFDGGGWKGDERITLQPKGMFKR